MKTTSDYNSLRDMCICLRTMQDLGIVVTVRNPYNLGSKKLQSRAKSIIKKWAMEGFLGKYVEKASFQVSSLKLKFRPDKFPNELRHIMCTGIYVSSWDQVVRIRFSNMQELLDLLHRIKTVINNFSKKLIPKERINTYGGNFLFCNKI